METIVLTPTEVQKYAVIDRALKGEVTVERAAQVLGLCERQVYRLKAKVKVAGSRGVAHGNRGQPSKRKLPRDKEARILQLARTTYRGFNDHHLSEKLQRREGIHVSRETVRRLLRAQGIGPRRSRRPPKHRSRRERKPQAGMMLQCDGSLHDWLEGRGPQLCLLAAIDDATNQVWARFEAAETTSGYFRLLRDLTTQEGLPLSLYADKHSIFKLERKEPTLEEQLRGKTPETQLERALRELGITLIYAHSPQAKGRIERFFGICQDRLISELRLAHATTCQQANAVLKPFLTEYHHQFTTTAPAAWRPLPQPFDPHHYFCHKEQRTVGADNCFSFQGRSYQLPATPYRASWAKAKVDVHLLVNNSLRVYYQDQRISFKPTRTTRLTTTPQPLNNHPTTLTFSRCR
jgi:transposase